MEMDINNDALESIPEWLRDIREQLSEDVEKTTIHPKNLLQLVVLYELYCDMSKEDSAKVGDCLANNGGAAIFTQYIRMFTVDGKSDSPSGENPKILTLLRGLCCNYSHISLNFCWELGKAGLFPILVSDLERCKDSLEEENVDEDECFLPCLTILYNCARDPRARRYLTEAKVLEALPPYIATKNNSLIVSKIVAILTCSYPIEEGQNEKPVANTLLFAIVHYLETAISTSDHKHLGFTAEELVDGLRRLANSDLNKVSILNAGIAPLLEKLLQTGDVTEQTIAASTLWSLCFAEENATKLSQNEGIKLSLKNLGDQPGRLGYLSSGALWYMKDHRRSNSVLTRSSQPGRDDAAVREARNGQIMISYSLKQKPLALEIKDRLEKLDYLVWMDMTCIEGKDFEGATNAVERSEVFLACVSHDYEAQPNCRMEAEHARRMQIPIIPILSESDYTMSGWLKDMLDSEECIHFSDAANYDQAVSILIKKIGDKGKKQSSQAKATENPTNRGETKVEILPSGTTSQSPVETWTATQVANWATENNLAPGHFHSVDGESLAYLRDMKKNSPEFYHKYVVENLEISKLQDLKNLSRGLENLWS